MCPVNLTRLNYEVQDNNVNQFQPSFFNQWTLTATIYLSSAWSSLVFCVYLCLSLRHQRGKTTSRSRRLQISLSERWALCQIGLYELMLWLRSSALARWVSHLIGCLPCPNWDAGIMPCHPGQSPSELHNEWTPYTSQCIMFIHGPF